MAGRKSSKCTNQCYVLLTPPSGQMWVLTEEAAPINQEFHYTSEGISNMAMCLCNFIVKLCMSNLSSLSEFHYRGYPMHALVKFPP